MQIDLSLRLLPGDSSDSDPLISENHCMQGAFNFNLTLSIFKLTELGCKHRAKIGQPPHATKEGIRADINRRTMIIITVLFLPLSLSLSIYNIHSWLNSE